MTMPAPTVAPPLALYVHFPWCLKKCPYCDFNSHAVRDGIDEAGYVDALLRDLDYDLVAHDCGKRKLVSIFLGGGTPNLFGASAIGRLLAAVRARIEFDDAIEITLEANPGAGECTDFAAYRACGINRLSLGAQSFDDAQLKNLGRIHNAAQIRTAIAAACDAGFDNINIDLIHGLPQQTPQSAVNDLQAALEFSPAHLSLYQLTIEPNTFFYRHPPTLPVHDRLVEIENAVHSAAAAHGYRRYEISAHARNGFECRHNFNYWQFGDYLGIGAGAHGKVSRDGTIRRYAKCKSPKKYLAAAGDASGIAECRDIAARDLPFEFLMNALRLRDGFDLAIIPEHTAQSSDAVDAVVDALGDAIARGWVVRENTRLRCSDKGYRFLDEILAGVLA